MNANTKTNLQNEAVAIITRYNTVISDIVEFKLKYDAIDGTSLFADVDVLNADVTGAEFKAAVGSLDTLATGYTGSGHKTNLYKVTG